ncbi:MAG TPA: helix-turn-helix domain-containing protein, partial [Pseudomonadales bacterium]
MTDDRKAQVAKLTTLSDAEDSSQALLEQAALEILQERGVLAGLNLREVAERAGVNRALVYHHFGSREALLRSALRRDLDTRLQEISEGLPLPFNARIRQLLRTLVRHQPAIRLALLLVLDGKEPVRLAPLQDAWLESFRTDRAQGVIDADLDLGALLVLVSTLSYGYALLRDLFAEELDVSAVELDWRIDALLERLLAASVER